MTFLSPYQTDSNVIFLSPKFEHLKPSLAKFLKEQHIKDRVLFLSSGTTSRNPKGYLFTKEALFHNAQAVNHHLNLTDSDQWGMTLPPFHIGGISVSFRSFLLDQSPVPLYPFTPEQLVHNLSAHHVTVISLVPTQIYDLVRSKLKAPAHLKYVLAGGDFLSQSLEEEALKLGWPILRTFGMSEVGSQLATAPTPGTRDLTILPLHKVKSDEEHRLWVKTPSLFSAELTYQEKWSLKAAHDSFDSEGYYPLPDKGLVRDGHLTHLGRYDGKIKVSGRLIDFLELKEKLDSHMLQHHCWGQLDLYLKTDERKSNLLCLDYDKTLNPHIMEDFLHLISPIKIDEILPCDFFHRNELGKKIRP
jgi:O-succinylbenzoic acid--CoA ligase